MVAERGQPRRWGWAEPPTGSMTWKSQTVCFPLDDEPVILRVET